MKYTIKLNWNKKGMVSKEISPHNKRQHYIIPFAVKEIINADGSCWSSSVVLRVDGFNKPKAKAMIKKMIKEYLAELAEQEEYEEEM